jgi:hypothetical protein
MVDLDAIAEEQRRLDRLRRIADATCALLWQAGLSREQGETLVRAARERALELFPEKGDVFDLVLAPRFRRILEEVETARGRRR